MKTTSALFTLGAVLQGVYAQSDEYPSRCYPDPCAGITSKNDSYVCGDSRLGPVVLPANFPLATQLQTYSRFGDLCPYEFLQKWATNIAPNGTYIYPPKNGFLVDTEGEPVQSNITLSVGQKVDRFGSEYGTFLAVLGAPYIERALPPSNLDTYDGAYPYNYYVYEVTKEFVVSGGPIAGWFEQPGLGTQFAAYDSVMNLIAGGFLRRLDRSEYDNSADYAADYLPKPASS